jgi:putative tricarboxylic transport membrane protein
VTRARVVAPPLAGVFLAIVLFWQTRSLDEVAQSGQLGPGFWPRLVLLGLGAASLAKLILDVRHAAGPSAAGAERVAISTPRLVAGIAAVVLYVVAAPLLGFALATIAFVAAFMWLAGARSPLAIAATAVLSTVAVLYVFIKVVYLPLPKGAGPVENLTLGLYRLLGIF